MSEVGNVSWNENLEKYFADTGEKSNCLSIVHKRAEEVYSHRRTYIDLPVICISGLTGFLSVGSTTMFEGHEQLSSVFLGIASLFVSVLNTIGTYFGWGARCQLHRVSSIQYARLYRFLKIEMGLPREERMTPADLLKHTRDAYDRLQEISPLLPPELIDEYRKKFEKYKDVSLPEELNGLERIVVFQDKFIVRNPLHSKSDMNVSVNVETPKQNEMGAGLERIKE